VWKSWVEAAVALLAEMALCILLMSQNERRPPFTFEYSAS
jgi:hypothetical protein